MTLEEAAEVFTSLRPRLFGIAYRMLSSATEAEDLMLMERLTPNERAAYVLREAFDYSYAEVADVLESTEPAVRQLVSRARKHMTSERRTPATPAAHRE